MHRDLAEFRDGARRFLAAAACGRGAYRYTAGADLLPIRPPYWGLAGTVFAVKALGALNSWDIPGVDGKQAAAGWIRRFKASGGGFRDRALVRRTWVRHTLSCLRRGNHGDLFFRNTVMAESRQAIAALAMLGERPEMPFEHVPSDAAALDRFLRGLDWNNPWTAVSHAGHAVFFYTMNARFFPGESESAGRLAAQVFRFLEGVQHAEDGFWYVRPVPLKIRVNAAMKAASTYMIAGRKEIPHAARIADAVLDSPRSDHADGCDNLNELVALSACVSSLGQGYRRDDIRGFCAGALQRYRKHFFPGPGGFGFFAERKQRRYYGLRVSAPYAGPDVHGTMLFSWALALVARLTGEGAELFGEVVN